MLSLGPVPSGSTLYIPFTSYGKTNGESITMTGFAVTDIEIYKNGSITQRSSDAGIALLDTDGTDFDGVTGLHGFSIDLSDNTDAGFYAVGSWYWVVVSSVTIDSSVVTFLAAVFRIAPSESLTGYPKGDIHGVNGDTTAAANLAKSSSAIVTGTVTSGANASSIPTSVCSPSGSVPDQFKGRIMIFQRDTTSVALRGQATNITASTASATPTFTVTSFTTSPASGDVFVIV